jgi:hypothetical protein
VSATCVLPHSHSSPTLKKEWGFDADDVKREFELELQKMAANGQTIDLKYLLPLLNVSLLYKRLSFLFFDSFRRGFKWSKLAKKLGNERFLQLEDPGPKIKAILRRKYPELIGEKVKVRIKTIYSSQK